MMTRTLLEFIEREQALGTSREIVMVRLRERGWTDADISAAEKVLSDEGSLDVPRPRTGTLGEFQEMLVLMWNVYRGRWKRFLGAGLTYFGVLLFLSLAMFMLVIDVVPLFLGFVSLGNTAGAFSLIAPYLLLGICVYVLIELWYAGTLYSIALRKGESLLERLEVGLCHLPAILGIKIAITLLLLISFAPLFVATVLTQNLLVPIIFGPLFLLGALLLGALFSLAIPAYMHGVPWREATLHSIHIVWKNLLSIILFYVLAALVLFAVTAILRHTGLIAVVVSIGLLFPMEVLFMIALYRRFAPSEVPVVRMAPSVPQKVEVKAETFTAPARPKSPVNRSRKTSKPVVA